MTIPPHLHDADQLLTKYGQWAKDRPSYRRCGSAEGRYRSTDVHHGVAAPVVLIADWSAAKVQRALNGVPETHRLLLTTWYVPSRGQGRKLRLMRKTIPKVQWEGMFLDALTIFRNVHNAGNI